MDTTKNDTKKIFRKKGTCSRTFCYLLDREFGHIKRDEERASDPLAGGLMMTGHQCGMLWGASLAAGAQAFRRHDDRGRAVAAAVTATRFIVESFVKRTGTPDCRDITGCDLTTGFGRTKLMVKTVLCGFIYSRCFNLAERWAPEAIGSAREGLSRGQTGLRLQPVSCACEVARKMGAGDEHMVMVAGFAGGLGLSGNACGALAAALWMKTLARSKENPGQNPPFLDNPDAQSAFRALYGVTGREILCHKITGRHFETLDDHTEFIQSGGCDKLIAALAGS